MSSDHALFLEPEHLKSFWATFGLQMAWASKAACSKGDGIVDETFFAEETSDGYGSQLLLEAKKICLGCPVKRECLQWAYYTEDSTYREGVFGQATGPQREMFANVPNRVDALLAYLELEAETQPALRTRRLVTLAEAKPKVSAAI